MQITRYTDYSLRVLLYVALKGDELVTIREIAERYGISKNHLMKIVHELSTNGYLYAVRGKNGGIRLNRAPQSIVLGELVRHTERERPLAACFVGGEGCVIAPACELKGVFAQAQDTFYQVLDQYTLADLLPQASRPQLLKLLDEV